MNTDISSATADMDRNAGNLSPQDIAEIHLTQAGSETMDVTVPAGQNIVRVPVTAGSTIRLPFEDTDLDARLGDNNGNLAIKSGDTTIILLGYAEASQAGEINVVDASGDPIDVAATVAATDPNIDIQTAAGAGAGDLGAGVDNNGGVFTPFDPSAGIGGLTAIGGLGATALSYGLIQRTNVVFELEEEPEAAAAAVVNQAPINYNDANSGNEKGSRDSNVMIVLDASFSMSEDANHTLAGVQQRLDIAKAVLANLLFTYEMQGDVRVTIVTFGTDASLHFSWGSVADAIASLGTVIANGLTNYPDALEHAADAWVAPGKLGGDTDNIVYFLSDGVPTTTGGVHVHLTDAQKDAWDAFLETPANGIDHVYAVGIGDDIGSTASPDPDLTHVAHPDGNNIPPGDVIYVDDPAADLSSSLISTIEDHPIAGNVLTGVDTSGIGDNGVPGQPDVAGDGATHIYTLTYAGVDPGFSVEFSWDGSAVTVAHAGGTNVSTNNLEVSFDTEHGRMTFDFASGNYIFVPGEVLADTDVTFHYGTKDADGDVDLPGGTDADAAPGGADLVISIIDTTPVPELARVADDHGSVTGQVPTNEHELALLQAVA